MSDTAKPALRWGAATHEGMVRTENEDAYVAEPLVFAVADGMGGHQAGEVASALAVQTLRDRLADGVRSIDVVIAAVVEANAAIFHAAHRNAAQQGMGTTLTALAVMEKTGGDGRLRTLALVNVGDSRTYRVRNRKLERVTIDHSYVQELVATGHISEMEARTHPRRNIVTRALGIEPTVRVDSWTLSMVKGDRFVLCSDGLVDEVPDHEIELVAAGVVDPQAAAAELVAMANRHGGRDNVTVLVIDVLEGLEVPPETAAATPAAVASLGDTATVPVITDGLPGGPAAETTTQLAATPLSSAPPATTHVPVTEPVTEPVTAAITAASSTEGAPTQANALTEALPTTASGSPSDPATLPGTPGSPGRPERPKRRFTTGMFLFFLALASIIAVTATFIALAMNDDDDPVRPDETVTTEVEATVADTEPDPTLPPTTLPPETLPSTTLPTTTLPTTTAAPG